MKTETKILGGILLFTAVLLIGGIFFLSKLPSNNSSGGTVYQIDYTKGQKIGSDSAKVKLAEFSDFECPACAAAEPFVKKVRESFPPDKFALYYFHFPLQQHKYGRVAATVAEAAGAQGKFWEMHGKLFETQEQWSALPDATGFFLSLSRELNLDENKVQEVLDKREFDAKINADQAEGFKVGVNSTPTFFLNGKKLQLRSFDELEAAVAQEVSK